VRGAECGGVLETSHDGDHSNSRLAAVESRSFDELRACKAGRSYHYISTLYCARRLGYRARESRSCRIVRHSPKNWVPFDPAGRLRERRAKGFFMNVRNVWTQPGRCSRFGGRADDVLLGRLSSLRRRSSGPSGGRAAGQGGRTNGTSLRPSPGSERPAEQPPPSPQPQLIFPLDHLPEGAGDQSQQSALPARTTHRVRHAGVARRADRAG